MQRDFFAFLNALACWICCRFPNLDKSFGAPRITKDGVTVAKEI
jgi:hypothetical protein